MIMLNELNLNEEAIVIDVKNDKLLKRRLLDIGIIPGINIKKILISPFKGIAGYLVMDSIIAIRDNDAKFIEVAHD